MNPRQGIETGRTDAPVEPFIAMCVETVRYDKHGPRVGTRVVANVDNATPADYMDAANAEEIIAAQAAKVGASMSDYNWIAGLFTPAIRSGLDPDTTVDAALEEMKTVLR